MAGSVPKEQTAASHLRVQPERSRSSAGRGENLSSPWESLPPGVDPPYLAHIHSIQMIRLEVALAAVRIFQAFP